jgi:hypothetical protein
MMYFEEINKLWKLLKICKPCWILGRTYTMRQQNIKIFNQIEPRKSEKSNLIWNDKQFMIANKVSN